MWRKGIRRQRKKHLRSYGLVKGSTFYTYYTFETVYYVFYPITQSVCVSVCRQDCDEMAGPSYTALREAITLDNSKKIQHYQDDLFVNLAHMDHLYKFTFWPITSKLIKGFATKNKQHIAHLRVKQFFFTDLEIYEEIKIL